GVVVAGGEMQAIGAVGAGVDAPRGLPVDDLAADVALDAGSVTHLRGRPSGRPQRHDIVTLHEVDFVVGAKEGNAIRGCDDRARVGAAEVAAPAVEVICVDVAALAAAPD